MTKNTTQERRNELSAIWQFIKLARRLCPGHIPLATVSAIIDAIAPFPGIVIPGYILNELAGPGRTERLLAYIGMLLAGNVAVGFTGSIVRKKLKTSEEKLADRFELHVGRHIMHMDFEKLEDAGILDMKEKALFNLRLHNVLTEGPATIAGIFRLLITAAGVTGLIAMLNPVLIVALFFLTGVNAWLYRRVQATKQRFYQDIAVYNRQFMYFRNLTQDFTNAKDVRIYRMSSYILERISRYYSAADRIFHKMFLTQRRHDGLGAVIIQMQTVLACAFAVWGVFRGKLMIGDFTIYISAAIRFSASATELMTKLVDLQMLGRVLQDYLAFERLPERNLSGKRSTDDIVCVRIEFRNVWFRYPNMESYALKDVSLIINSGERLSIAGKNGAGKSTFIKLLCRLYRPEKGCILLNGVDINDFEEAQYSRLLSVLFQDYKIFSFSIRENLAFDRPYEQDRGRNSLKKAGILEKVQSLPLGADTPLYKNFDKDGAELSGGEMQKIAIARILYKDAPLLVLDEPAANLDPYSEYDLYSRFNAMTEGKTTIYISHRLSSCRFCDAIAVFEDGRIVEYGSHEELVCKGGLYARMWQAQAQYYQ